MKPQTEARRDFAAEQYASSTSNLDARLALHARFSVAPQTWHEWLFDTIALRGGEGVIEMGAGTGQLWAMNAGRIPAEVRLHLTDISIAMCHRLRAEVPIASSTCRADAQRLPFRDGAADVVVASHMLYHVPDQRAAVKEAARVLRVGGRAIFATNGTNHMNELWSLLATVGVGTGNANATHRAFALEDAQQSVGTVFADTRVATFDDELRVTDPAALIAYIESFTIITAAQRHDLEDEITRRMTDGYISITKSVGAVEARIG